MKELAEATKRSVAHRNDGSVPKAWEGIVAGASGALVTWEWFMGPLCLLGSRRMSDKRRQPRAYSFTKCIRALQLYRDLPRWPIQE